jgi:hypothetical protein
MPKRATTRLVALYAVAVLLGIASAWLWVTRIGISGVDAGQWRVNLLAGSTQADAYTRARIAIFALLALDRRETLYYTTDRDDGGASLRAECPYSIALRPPTARWWSITAYAADGFLFPNKTRRYSVSGENANVDADGWARFLIAPQSSAAGVDARITTSGAGAMRLTLRLYQPDEGLQRAPQALDPPRIKKIGRCVS